MIAKFYFPYHESSLNTAMLANDDWRPMFFLILSDQKVTDMDTSSKQF